MLALFEIIIYNVIIFGMIGGSGYVYNNNHYDNDNDSDSESIYKQALQTFLFHFEVKFF